MTASKKSKSALAAAVRSSSNIQLEAQAALRESSLTGHLEPYTDYTDLDNEDSPPAYTDHDESSRPGGLPGNAIRPEEYDIPGGRILTSQREGKTYTVSLAPFLSSNAEVLGKFFKQQAALAPLVFISVKGTHTVSRRNGDKQTSSDTVTDFDFMIDGSDTILPPVSGLDRAHRVMKVVQDNDGVSAYRGGRFKSTSSGRCRTKGIDNTLESGGQTTDAPTLEEWCQRFCSDKSSVKSFTLHREVLGWDFNAITNEITSLIRSTNYRGAISVSPFIRQSRVTVLSPSLLNRLRTNSFVWWACVILQLWVITWPLLILLERRFEVVRVEHRVIRNTSYTHSERHWVNMFAPAIKAAALGRRTGEVVTKADIARAQEPPVDGRDSEAERERRERMARGQATWSDSIVGIVRGVSEARQQLNSNYGWGADE